MGGGLGSYGGATSTTAIYMYGMAFSSAANYSYGAAISTGMLVLMVALAALMFRLFRGQQDNTPRKDEK
jgi:ABC-type sugar transport system permease subunit